MADHVAGISVRSAVLEDAADISRLNEVLGYRTTDAQMYVRLKELLDSPDHLVAIAIQDHAQTLLGWVAAEKRLILESGRRVDIVGLVVSPDSRQQGVGRCLLSAVEDWATRLGVEQVRVQCNLKRAEAHEFYKRLGFAEVKRQVVYLKG